MYARQNMLLIEYMRQRHETERQLQATEIARLDGRMGMLTSICRSFMISSDCEASGIMNCSFREYYIHDVRRTRQTHTGRQLQITTTAFQQEKRWSIRAQSRLMRRGVENSKTQSSFLDTASAHRKVCLEPKFDRSLCTTEFSKAQ